MTNKNSHWNSAEPFRCPFLLKPIGKNYLWGGNRLNDDFSKEIDLSPLAETWECSTHPDGSSIVHGGDFDGMSLKEVLHLHPELLGDHVEWNDELPILIKLIDAKENLSVQVHPDDQYAKAFENGQLGKTELWYVLDATRDASLVYGLHHDVDPTVLRINIDTGTLENYLQRVPVKKNDVFYIEAGTIHAIGKGALIAEIQENSNLTYRLYDYNRVDKMGKKRELHIDKALDVAKLSASAEPIQPMRVLKYIPGSASELLCRCQYFEVHRIILNTERCRQMVKYQSDSHSFRVLLCVDGCGSIYITDHESLRFFKGDCVFIPANSVEMKIHGKAQFLDVRV